MPEKPMCEKIIHKGSGFLTYAANCPNRGTVQRDDKWYCGIHDPVKAKERQDARDAKWDAKWDEERKIARRQSAESHYCEKLTTEYMERNQAEMPDA